MSEDSYIPGNPSVRDTAPPVVITGCSGSGKSSLLAELSRRGLRVLPEAGRQIVKEQGLIGGDAVPWENRAKFAELAATRAAHHYNMIPAGAGLVFSDRSVVDVISFFGRSGLETPPHLTAMLSHYRYHPRVLMSPPWREIFHGDAERKHSFEDGVAEYEWLLKAYAAQGYELVDLPKLSIAERADFAVRAVSGPPRER